MKILKKEFTGISAHIILYCKNYYGKDLNVEFLTGIRRIWAIRCGYDFDEKDKSIYKYIAQELYELMLELHSEKVNHYQELIHDRLCNNLYKEYSAIENLILFYKSEIAWSTCKERKKSKLYWIYKLPRPKKQIFNKIISGKGQYYDYKKISN